MKTWPKTPSELVSREKRKLLFLVPAILAIIAAVFLLELYPLGSRGTIVRKTLLVSFAIVAILGWKSFVLLLVGYRERKKNAFKPRNGVESDGQETPKP